MGLLALAKFHTVDRLKYYAGFGVGSGGFTVPANTYPDYGLSSRTARAVENAHQNPIVFAVVQWLANQVSGTPLEMSRTPEEGDREVVTVHPLLDLLRKPSEFLSGRELLSVSAWDMLLRGQTFWHKDRLRNGRVDSLTFIPAQDIQVKGTREQLITEYVYRPSSTLSPGLGLSGRGPVPGSYDPDDIVHIRLSPNPLDPKNGLPPLIALALALLVNDQRTDYTSTFLQEVGAAGGFLMPPEEAGVLSEDVTKATREFIQNEFKGSKRGTLGVLRTAMNFIRTTIDPKTAGTHDVYDEVVELICAVFGVHPVILGLRPGSAQSRVGAATKELERAAQTNRVIPMQDTISEQIGRQLLPEFVDEAELDQWMMDWDRSKVLSLQPDLLREAQRWNLLMRAGISTRYDAKIANDLEADDTDRVYLIPMNIQIIPEGQPPPLPQQQEEPSDPDTTDPEDPEDPDDRPSGPSQAMSAILRTKASLSPEQRDILVAQAADAEVLAAEFAGELEAAFEDLGDRAVEAFWVAEGGRTLFAVGNGPMLKQGPEDVVAEVNRIMANLSVTVWEQGVLIPAWDGQTLRTLNTTVGTVNSTLGLGVNLPDPVARGVIDAGGTRRGLIDFTTQSRDALFRSISEGRAAGEGPVQLARRIRSQVPAGPFPNAGVRYRAQLIARTEVKYSQNVASRTIYEQSDSVNALLCVDAQGSGPQDSECTSVDGREFTFAEAEDLGDLAHPSCTRSWSPVIRRS